MNPTYRLRPVRLGATLFLTGWLALTGSLRPTLAAPPPPASGTPTAPLVQQFEDVPDSNPFSTFINSLYLDAVVSGYTCGGINPPEPCGPGNLPYYRPNNTVTRAQMAKFVDNARHLPGILITTATHPQPIFASTGAAAGIGLEGVHSAPSGTTPGVRGSTNSTVGGAVGVEGIVIPTAPGGSSAGVRGINNGTGSSGIGVYGSHAGSGWGVYGLSIGGRGVFGSSTDAQGVYGLHSAATGTAPGVYGTTASTDASASGVQGVVSSAAAGGLSAGVRGVNNGTGSLGIGVYGSHAGSGWGVYGLSLGGRGVFGSSTNAEGIYGLHTATTGSAPGVYGSTASTASNAYGVEGVVETTAPGVNSAGVRGVNNGTGVLGIGVYGSHAGGGWGVSGTSVTGIGVFGTHSAATGTAPGVYGTTASAADNAAAIEGVLTAGPPGGRADGVRGVLTAEPPFNAWWSSGVHGQVAATTSDTGIGVYGSHAGGGIGVFGYSGSGTLPFFNSVIKSGVNGISEDDTGVSGVSLGDGNGVYGGSESGNGVRAHSNAANGTGSSGAAVNAWNDGGGYAGYFGGEVVVTGNCCAAAMGTFRIDDPQDPAHQYLTHAAVASDELLDLYNGTVILDTQGRATVELPTWFTAVNGTFRYQLTAIGAPGPNLYIAQEIADNRFAIAGGAPGGKVSWQVTGVRHDPYATAHPISVVEPKPADAQGTYLHPELYGQPETAGENWAPPAPEK